MSASEQGVLNAQMNTEIERQQPHVLMRPKLMLDGDMYCALYGDNIQEGCCGFGKTPAEAMYQFDLAWAGVKA